MIVAISIAAVLAVGGAWVFARFLSDMRKIGKELARRAEPNAVIPKPPSDVLGEVDDSKNHSPIAAVHP